MSHFPRSTADTSGLLAGRQTSGRHQSPGVVDGYKHRVKENKTNSPALNLKSSRQPVQVATGAVVMLKTFAGL